MSNKQDLKISGASTVSGGDYGNVTISGSGKIDGNLRADSVTCSGSAKVLGNVVTPKLTCSGSCHLDGEVQSENVRVAGSIKIDGNLTGDVINLGGAIKILRSIKCTHLDVAGGLVVGENIETEQLHLKGCTKIDGLLNAEEIKITSSPTSRIKDIGCSNIEVRKTKPSLFGRLFSHDDGYALEVNSIEADQVDLEDTKADIIRCNDIWLGKGCKIRRVEYTGTCKAEDGAVEELVQVK